MNDRTIIDQITCARQAWEKQLIQKEQSAPIPEEAALPGYRTGSGIELKMLYSPEDAVDLDYLKELGFPGEFPFTRGIQPDMYRGKLWSMRQYAGFGTAEDSNRRFKYLLSQGQTGLSVAFDLPTQIGYDSDHPLAHGEIGKVGVAIDSLSDMEVMFEGIELNRISTSMTINAPALVILAMYIAVAEKQKIDLLKLRGTIQNDILKEYVARGTYIFPPRPSMRLVVDSFDFCARHMPNWNVISICGYHMREAGANAVQEIAFSFANAIAYLDAARNAGLDLDSFASRISWVFNTQNNFFEEVAKYRAARRLWAKLMKESFSTRDPRSWMLRMHVQNGGSVLTAQQPLNNIIRGTLHALATVLGGAQSMAICSYDEAHSIPSEEAATLSLRTQHIIAVESGVGEVVDPLAGSYFIEKLTRQMEMQMESLLHEIDQLGGAVNAIEKGFMQQQIERQAYQQQCEIESGQRGVVGVNRFVIPEKTKLELNNINLSVEQAQLARLARVKMQRDQNQVIQALARVKEGAQGNENMMPAIINAVKTYATLGEICEVLRQVFGEYQQTAG